MFPYYPLQYNAAWTAQFRAAQAQAQLQHTPLGGTYNIQPTLIQQAQLQQIQQAQIQQQRQQQQQQQQHKYNSNHRLRQYKAPRNGHNNHTHLYPKTCQMCNVVCNSSLQWNMHINGKKHTKQTRGVQFHKEHSRIDSTSIYTQSTEHDSSLKNGHKNETYLPSDQYVVEIDGRRKCALCHVEFTSAMCEMSHIKGKRHKMAARGHNIFPSKKRKYPSETLGRCQLCDVDFTSQTQKDSHLTGKKHSKNVRLVEAGQPPKKRQKTNYFSSFKKAGPVPTMIPSVSTPYTEKANEETLKPHQILQLRVERIYKEYTEIAKSSHPLKAQQIYQKYQDTYDEYIKEYNLFADNFKKEQKPIQKEEQTSENDTQLPTMTVISTATEIKTENQIKGYDD